MGTEILRRAANKMREDNRHDAATGDATCATLVAVADWLEAISARFPARLRDFEEHLLDREQSAALVAARTYIGEDW